MGLLINVEQGYYASGGDHGSYRFLSLKDIIEAFKATYVGKGKVCENVFEGDIVFHAGRALQELSYDTLKVIKNWEVEIPASLMLVMPVDYVNYCKLTWADESGVERIIYPADKTSNPRNITETVNADGGFTISGATDDLAFTETSDTREKYNSQELNTLAMHRQDRDAYNYLDGNRYGIDPQYAQINGSFYIDEQAGKFHFSSNISGKTVILKYISDGLITNSEHSGIDYGATPVPKFAEEAMYKHMLFGILLSRKDTPGGLLAEIKKQKFAETRKTKLRLQNFKLEEYARILRGGSKIIKH